MKEYVHIYFEYFFVYVCCGGYALEFKPNM